MYFYLYDTFLNDKKYDSLLTDIEGRLLNLGISGKVGRLTVLKSAEELIVDGIKKGCQTVVAVGNDQTISRVISIIARHDVVLGVIPLGAPSQIARILGIPQGVKACDTLSARIIEKIDLGKINGHYFFSAVEIPAAEVKLECDGCYQVELKESSDICISNIGNFLGFSGRGIISNPRDGFLEASVCPTHKRNFFLSSFYKKEFKKDSFFPIKKVKIVSEKEEVQLIADGQEKIKTPATVEIVPKKLKVVVGRQRTF